MTFDPGTWWLVVGLLGLGGTALAFLLKRNMTESDRTKDRVTELEARSAQKSDVDKALEKVNKTVAEQGKAISHIEKTYVERMSCRQCARSCGKRPASFRRISRILKRTACARMTSCAR